MSAKTLLNSFDRDIGFVDFQIQSYNNFVKNRLQSIVSEIAEIKPEVPEIGALAAKIRNGGGVAPPQQPQQ